MNRPSNIREYDKLDLKLGIKSSVPNIKRVIALLILLFEAENHPDRCIYSESVGDNIVLKREVLDDIFSLCIETLTNHSKDREDLENAVNKNALIKGLKEHLEVAVTLMLKLGFIEFVGEGLTPASERTERIRHPKLVIFSAFMDILSSALSGMDYQRRYETLLNWLGILDIPEDPAVAEMINEIITVFTEFSLYKLDDNGTDVIFSQNEVYKAILSDEENFADPFGDGEKKGSLRVLGNLLDDNINPYITKMSNGVTVKGSVNNLAAYQSRTDTLRAVFSVKDAQNVVPSPATAPVYRADIEYNGNRNCIFFGAPGTGKSHEVDKQKNLFIGEDNDTDYERVTFYPDYTYGSFVGSYKPVTNDKGDIVYEYVPGPFMRIYTKALANCRTDEPKPFILIVEEINRANAAAVFGELFQLLDRDDDGVSEYPVETSEDVKKYLAKVLGGTPETYNKIRIPNNMFIWVTLNSADQGVTPLDTAFKRRWDYKYIGIDDNELNEHNAPAQDIEFTIAGKEYHWSVLRRAINSKLSSADIRAHEDKLMGPYFVKVKKKDGTPLVSAEDFIEVFCQKVLMYLFDDVAKTKRKNLFSGINPDTDYEALTRFSVICERFRQKGALIFGESFMEEYYEKSKEALDEKIATTSRG